MINLLPLNEKVKIRSEYRLRFLTVFVLSIALLFLTALIPLAISYYVISHNVEFINDVSEKLSKSEGFRETEGVLRDIKNTNRMSTILNDPVGVSIRQNILGSISSVFNIAHTISSQKNGSVKINQISYDQATRRVAVPAPSVAPVTGTSTPAVRDSGNHTLSLRGFASSRDIFLLFLKELGSDKNFLTIDSPVSNLVNNANIDFNVSIVLRDRAQ
jgi:hypothetical protein